MKEVITLQFGEQANYVGAHYWNLMQAATSDEAASAHPSGALSMDTLFCERDGGGGRGAQRYTPRALVFDQPGNYMAQGDPDAEEEKEQEAEKAEEASVQWNGQQVEVHRQTPHARQPPPLLHESTPRYWTDILEQSYGAQTVHGISGVEFGSSLGQMATFNEGRNVFTGMNAREDMLEGAFRNYAEACDQLQGFQALSDAQGGFAGFGMAFLECVRQEYPKSPIVLYNAQATRLQQIGVGGRVDVAVALASALEQDVSMSVPLFAPPRVAGLYGGGAWMAANVAQWSWSVVAGVQGLGDVVDCATRQRGFRVAETLLAPGLDVGAADDLVGVIESSFVACSDTKIASLGELAGCLFADRGTRVGRLVRQTMSSAACVEFEAPVALPRTFPAIFGAHKPGRIGGVASIGVAGLLCSTTGSVGYLQALRGSLDAEHSKYLKDYEREAVREFKHTLDSAIDTYSMIG